MSQALLRIERLPEPAVEAAGTFYGEWAARARGLIEGGSDALAIIMAAAPYDHADWRRAAARDLARAAAPVRVNIVSGDSDEAIAETLAFLDAAPGVTGQYLPLAGQKTAGEAD